jgi:pimeloyl-ACP methyl ester carboxylesterase
VSSPPYNYRGSLDHLLAKLVRGRGERPSNGLLTDFVQSTHGSIRYLDTEVGEHCVIFMPDGPNSIEHYADLVGRLSATARVICFDMPGFGFSLPSRAYDHSLASGARVVLDVMDARGVSRATLASSCANGLYALRVAQLAPERVSRLVLSQTPSLEAMHRWAHRNVPKPIQTPIVGQVLSCLLRRKIAHRWYSYAVPSRAHVETLRSRARLTFDAGACFCLAGVVQGLLRESVDALGQVGVQCTLLWGEQDRSHRDTDPLSLLSVAPAAEVIRLPMSGHFPDLEESSVLISLLQP